MCTLASRIRDKLIIFHPCGGEHEISHPNRVCLWGRGVYSPFLATKSAVLSTMSVSHWSGRQQ